jgi:magnesium chelatase subunit D
MKPRGYPFAALVGLDTLKLALQLAAIDARLSVLIRGDKGAGKSTAARGLAEVMEASAPFINLPIGTTEDRLLGGLDIERALKGEPALKSGLLAEAHDGVLYVDEVNLLPDHLADALLDAVASGVHVVEREGFSVTQPADFVMIGTMNPEEGALRPQLLDRFALAVDVDAPTDADTRAEVLARRLSYDADASLFRAGWTGESEDASRRLAAAKARVTGLTVSPDILRLIAERVIERNIRSLRADLAIVRASRALAALENADAVTSDHVERVLPLALAHRSADRSPRKSPPPPTPPQSEKTNESPSDSSADERVFAAVNVQAPRLVVDNRQPATSSQTGPVIRARLNAQPNELDLRTTLARSATRGSSAGIVVGDLHEKVRQPRETTRYIFVVDASGSHAIGERMRFVKGAVSGLLAESQGRRDEVVVISCRGASAQVICEPTTSRDDAERALEYLPTGGRTPLAHALEVAAGYVDAKSALVVLTDGHANVARNGTDAWTDALNAAASVGCPSLVIDTEDERNATGRPRKIASALRGSHTSWRDLDQASVVRVIRGVA